MALSQMGIIKKILAATLLLCGPAMAQEPYVLRFAEQLQQIDPTQVGTYPQSQMGLYFVGQWIGIDQAPEEKGFWFNKLPTKQQLKWGGVLRNRSRFAENNTALLAQFSYPLSLSSNTSILLGIQVETAFYRLDFSKLQSVDGVLADPLLGRQSYWQPNLGVGFRLLQDHWYLRLALPQLFNKHQQAFFSDIRLADKPLYFAELGKHFTRLNQQHYLVRLQWHNVNWNSPSLQLQLDYHWRRVIGTLALNHRKMVGLGFTFIEKRTFSFRYGYQWQFASQNNLGLKQHVLALLIRFESLTTNSLTHVP